MHLLLGVWLFYCPKFSIFLLSVGLLAFLISLTDTVYDTLLTTLYLCTSWACCCIVQPQLQHLGITPCAHCPHTWFPPQQQHLLPIYTLQPHALFTGIYNTDILWNWVADKSSHDPIGKSLKSRKVKSLLVLFFNFSSVKTSCFHLVIIIMGTPVMTPLSLYISLAFPKATLWFQFNYILFLTFPSAFHSVAMWAKE